jgi:hypothetical protein
MKTALHYIICTALLLGLSLQVRAQKTDEVAPADVPAPVTAAINQYLQALQLADAAQSGTAAKSVLGGSLLEEDGKTLRTAVVRFAFPKDREHVVNYTVPAVVVKALKAEAQSDGDGSALIKGTWYKVWIGRKDGAADLAAPFTLILSGDNAKICYAIGNL